MGMTEKEYKKAIKTLEARVRKSKFNLSYEETLQKLKDRLKERRNE